MNIDLSGKKILIVGLGKTGKAILETLYQRVNFGVHFGAGEAAITVYDDKDFEWSDDAFFYKLKELGVKMILNEDFKLDEKFDYVFVSPGVPLDRDVIRKTEDSGAKIIGEIELAYLLNPANYVGITGTNGKTTTTTLTYEILKKAKPNVFLGGNIGDPIIRMAAGAKKEDFFVTEISSFQLETIDKFRPRVAAILNFSEDHLDRHKTYEKYMRAKERIIKNQTANDFLVYNFDDEVLRGRIESRKTMKPKLIPFSKTENLQNGVFIKGGAIVYGGEEIMSAEKMAMIKLKGEHNLENVLAAVAINLALGVSPEIISGAVSSFSGVAHRLEEVTEIRGISFINDSKGTNPDASVKAIEAIGKDILLIAGGFDKDADFVDFVESFRGRVKEVFLFGATKEKIAAAMDAQCSKGDSKNFPSHKILNSLKECMVLAFENAKAGDSILLSPACASWDMYKCFEERGDEFRRIAFKFEEIK